MEKSSRTTLHYIIQNDGARDLVLPLPLVLPWLWLYQLYQWCYPWEECSCGLSPITEKPKDHTNAAQSHMKINYSGMQLLLKLITLHLGLL